MVLLKIAFLAAIVGIVIGAVSAYFGILESHPKLFLLILLVACGVGGWFSAKIK